LSIYRKFEAMRRPSNDVYARTGVAGPRLVGSDESPQDSKYELRRKAEPANMALPRTLKWIDGLPPDVKPTALLRHYARIANVLAAAWDDPKAVSSYMDCLLRDDRGDRKGFPAEVSQELLALRDYHSSCNPEHWAAWEALHKRR
jgi:hypothetical protein